MRNSGRGDEAPVVVGVRFLPVAATAEKQAPASATAASTHEGPGGGEVRRRKRAILDACELAAIMAGNPLRFRLSILAACLLAGASIFACATPNLEGLDADPQATLPDRIPSLPTSDGGGTDASIVDPGPQDAAADQRDGADANRALHVFVSSALISGSALGGVAGADLKCNSLASAAGIPGTYRAWISVAGSNAADRITSSGPWYLVGGELVASTKAALVGGTLKHGIDHDEKNVHAPAAEDRVWTGTAPDGTFDGPECGVWSGGGQARVGEAEFSDGRWSSSTVESCGQVNRVYCFEL